MLISPIQQYDSAVYHIILNIASYTAVGLIQTKSGKKRLVLRKK